MKKVIGYPQLVRDANGFVHYVGKTNEYAQIRKTKEQQKEFNERIEKLEKTLEKLLSNGNTEYFRK